MVTKDQIIAAASKLFVEKGFENATMREIAERVGIFKGSLYHHIKSKADLFYEVLDMSLKKSTKSLKKVQDSKLDPEQKFRKIILAHFENIYKFSLEYQIVLNERRHMLNAEQERKIRMQMKAYENCVYDVLKDAIAANLFRTDLNPRVVVVGIMGVGNAIYKWFSPDGPLSFSEIANMYVELFIQGLRRDKERTP